MLNDHNWEPVKRFIESDQFKSLFDYANEGSAEELLKQVAEGFIALYGQVEHPDGMYILPSRIKEQGMIAVRELNGNWENVPNLQDGDVPRTICKMEPIPGTFGFNKKANSAVLLKKNRSPVPEEEIIIDQLLEDVLPHGYA